MAETNAAATDAPAAAAATDAAPAAAATDSAAPAPAAAAKEEPKKSPIKKVCLQLSSISLVDRQLIASCC